MGAQEKTLDPNPNPDPTQPPPLSLDTTKDTGNSMARASTSNPSWFTPKRLLAIFCVINLINYIDRGAIASNGVNGSRKTCSESGACSPGSGIQGDFDLSNFEDGVISSAFMVGLLVASPIFASSANSVNPFRLIGIGLSVWTVAVAFCGFSFNFWSIAIARMLVGVGEASFISLAAPFIDDNAPVAQRTAWLGAFYMCIPTGIAVGYVYGGLISNFGWRWAFWVEAILMLPFVVFFSAFISLSLFLSLTPPPISMASHHPLPASDLDSNAADSVASTPRSDFHEDSTIVPQPRVRFMCSFGGKILPRPHDNQLRYFGGDTRIVAIHRHTTLSALLSKLSKLSGTTNVSIKYQLPNEDLDALITVTADEDVENMMEEYDRLSQNQKSARLRLFLFPIDNNDSRASSINSLLDGSAKRENWFVDVLNGGPAAGPVLERGRSEVSSIVSEVPDYLFGLDNSDDALKESTKLKNKHLINDNVSMSDPGSPAPVVSSPFCSTSSALAPPNLQVIADLPPVKTKPVNPVQVAEQRESELAVNEKMPPQPTGYPGGPVWHYPNPPVQPMPAVYYVQGSHVQAANASVPIRAQFLQSYPVSAGQVPIGFPGMNHVYGAGVRPYEMPARYITDNAGQPVYYGARNVAVVPGSFPGLAGTGAEEVQGSAPDMIPGRVSQGS